MNKNNVFIDLDGTLTNTMSGDKFPRGVYDMKLNFSLLNALKNYAPMQVFIVSNQGGIELGITSEKDIIAKLQYVSACIADYVHTKCTYSFARTNNKEDICRKPNSGMLEIRRYTDNILPRDCVMVGDASGLEGQFSDSDKKCAENFGILYYDVNEFINLFNPELDDTMKKQEL